MMTAADIPASAAALAGFFAAVLAAAAPGALFQPGAWYRTLRKPVWTPPDWLFGIAWTVLYVVMALAAWLVARSGQPLAAAGVGFWCCQLVLNTLWAPVVFGLHRLGTGVLVIALLWIAIALTAWLFWQSAPLAGWLMLPYLVWASFAFALNLTIWLMNPRSKAMDLS